MFYKILDTETTRDLVPDLIGDTFLKVGTKDGYIKLDTCDGVLLFAASEIQEVEI